MVESIFNTIVSWGSVVFLHKKYGLIWPINERKKSIQNVLVLGFQMLRNSLFEAQSSNYGFLKNIYVLICIIVLNKIMLIFVSVTRQQWNVIELAAVLK